MLVLCAGLRRRFKCGDGDNDGLGRKNSLLWDTMGRPVGHVGGFIGRGSGNEGGWSTLLSQRGIRAFNAEKRYDSRRYFAPDKESFPI